MATVVEVVLVNGERRTMPLPRHTGSIANALGRLDDWIKTDDGGWVQKRFIVEVRALEDDRTLPPGSAEEFERLSKAAGTLTDQADDEKR